MPGPVKPRGPAANHPPSLAPDNPYNFPDSLIAAARLEPKVTDKHIFFFGYEGDSPYVCFQQWFPAPFKAPSGNVVTKDSTADDMIEFPTTEHYMMYRKAVLMNDDEIAKKTLDATHPSAAKRLGREVKNFDPDVWTKNADHVVEEGNYFKFNQNEDLKEVLLESGNREIVEASPDDRIWGIGFKSDEAEGNEAKWGNNGLGKALMRVRDRLRKERLANKKHETEPVTRTR